MDEAAERVTFATTPSAELLTAPSSLSVRDFPPKKNTKTTSTSTKVNGTAIIGEANQSRTSSIAATPRAIKAQVGIEAEYVYFCFREKVHFCEVPILNSFPSLLPTFLREPVRPSQPIFICLHQQTQRRWHSFCSWQDFWRVELIFHFRP